MTQWIYISCCLIVILCNYLELLYYRVSLSCYSVCHNQLGFYWSLSWLLIGHCLGFLLDLFKIYSVFYVLWSCDRVKFWYIGDTLNFYNTRFYIFDRWEFLNDLRLASFVMATHSCSCDGVSFA